MTILAYCRKSTDDSSHQVLSMDSQESEMQKLAERSGLTISKVYRESMTAKAPGRPVFAEMITFVQKHPGATILVWKLDRLARNPVDEGMAKWLLQQGVIHQIKTPDRDYNPGDNALIASVEFGMANQFIRDLRQNVLRGNRAKLEKGGWPSVAPFGYDNNRADKTIMVNSKTARAVRRIFDQYASGNFTLDEITETIYEQGYRSRNEKKISRANIHHILQNHFYYGVMVHNGIHYAGKHEPLISQETFNRVQDVLSGKHQAKHTKHFFPLRGFMTCDACGCTMTATKQKGRYVYYYCTNGKGICDQRKKHLREAEAVALVGSVLQGIKVDPRKLDLACRASKAKKARSEADLMEIRKNLDIRLREIQDQQDMLVRRKDVPEDVYARNMTALKNEQVDIEVKVASLDRKNEQEQITFEQAKGRILQSNYEADAFISADPLAQRKYLESVLSNVWVKDQKVQRFQFKPAFQILANLPKNASIEQVYPR